MESGTSNCRNKSFHSPDNGYTSFSSLSSSFIPNLQPFKVMLLDNNRALFSDQSEGNWTMIYDQGMDIMQGLKSYTIYFSYYIKEGHLVVSDCSTTLIGWFYDRQTNEVGCFRALKTEADGKFFIISRAQYFEYNGTYSVPPAYVRLDEEINILLKGTDTRRWKQIFKKGIFLHDLISMKERGDFLQTEEGIAMPSMLSNEEIMNGLPKKFNWKRLMDDQPLDQEDCGMCYAAATISMLNARARLHLDERVNFSLPYILDCSYYTQACHGGYSYLVSKFGYQHGLLLHDCYPTTKGSCQPGCDETTQLKSYRIREHYYVGGSYGLSNELAIMEEIYKNGPIVVSIRVGDQFDDLTEKFVIPFIKDSTPRLRGTKPEWEELHHSVLCLGWGEDDNQNRYWILRNSWGKDYGNNGYFYIRRGLDDYGVESMGEAAMLEVIQNTEAELNKENEMI